MDNSRLFCLLVFSLLAPGALFYTISFRQFPEDGGLPNEIILGDGESMLLYWRPTEKPLKSCILTTPDTTTVDLFKETQSNFVRPELLSSKNGFCCVRVQNVNGKTNGTWTLTASAGSKLAFNTNTTVTVLPQPTMMNRNYSIIESSVFTIKCGREEAYTCQLISPKGKITSFYNGPCSTTVFDANIFHHEGEWHCSYYLPNFITEYSDVTKVKIIEDETKELIVKELEKEILLYCVSPKANIRFVKYCKITTPYGLDLYLTPGKAYERYTYYGSKPYHCGITIPKPLAPQDKGNWKCQLAQDLNGYPKEIYGGYTNIGEANKLEEIKVEAKEIFWTSNNEKYLLKCHVPNSIEYCWFRSPNGTIYNIQDKINFDQRTLGFKFGDCVLNVPSTEVKNATGIWTCNIGISQGSITELRSKINVTYSDVPIVATKREVTGYKGDAMSLGCHTGSGIGIQYCRFIRPDGEGLLVDPLKNNSKYSYHGAGFLYGYCGIKIQSLEEEDIGTWICSVKLKSITSISSDTIAVTIETKEEKGSLLFLYIAIGFGSLLLLLGLSYLIMRRYEFKIRSRVDDANTSLIQSETTEEDIDVGNNLERINNTVRYVRRRSPRPTRLSPESSSSYI